MRYLITVLAAASLLGYLGGVPPGNAQTHKPTATKKMATKKAAKMMYECKMDGSKSSKPGNCPKCGMKMTKMSGMDHSKMTGKMMYECKMDGAKSSKPGNCPKCGMKMTKM